MLGLSINAGLNFIDTANAYIGGKSEKILGNILGRARRDSLALAKNSLIPWDPSQTVLTEARVVIGYWQWKFNTFAPTARWDI